MNPGALNKLKKAQLTINNQGVEEGSRKGSKVRREKLEAKVERRGGLAQQMVSEFLPEALHTHRKERERERRRDDELNTLTTHLHFLSSSASEGWREREQRESRRSFDRHHQHCAAFSSLSVHSNHS